MNKLPFFNFRVTNNTSTSTCDVFIDGEIVDASTEQVYKEWWGDDTARSFKSIREEITNSGAKTINVYVNSPGGQVTEAMAIHDYLKGLENSGKTVNTYGRGIIASAATYILMASSNSSISENSWFMIHNVSGWAFGDVNQVENQAATLRKFNDTVIDFYSNHTGLSATVIGNMMNKETWMTGKEAADKKFVKKCETEQSFTNSIKPENWLFQNTQVLAAYNSAIQNPLNMDFKNLINDIKDAFSNSLKEAGILKDENTKLAEQVTNALDAAFAPMNDGLNKAIDETVEARLKDLDTTITNKVNEAIQAANQTGLTETALEEKLKPINDSIKEIENKLTSGAGSAGSGSGTPANNGKVDVHNHPGVTW